MLLLVPAAFLTLGARWLWFQPRRPIDPNPLVGRLSASFTDPGDIVADRVSIDIRYNLALSVKHAQKGTTYLVWAEVWLEDQSTRLPTVMHTFAAPLTVGGRESVSGAFTWKPIKVRPGTYDLNHRLRFQDPSRGWTGHSGGRSFGIEIPAAQ